MQAFPAASVSPGYFLPQVSTCANNCNEYELKGSKSQWLVQADA